LLDANPLENISNTKQITAVVVNGRLLDKQKLQKLLGQAETAAHGQSHIAWAVMSIAAGLLAYLAAYFLSARVNYVRVTSTVAAVPLYHPWNANLVRIIFAPAHLLDSLYLRPIRWRAKKGA
jgi:hypothetical protein